MTQTATQAQVRRNRGRRNNKKFVEGAEASPSEAKTPSILKPEPKIAKSSSTLKSKESNSSLSAKGEPEKTDNTNGRKENNSAEKTNNRDSQGNKQRDRNSKENVGGFVFMCNRNTKPDCYRYMVMGLPESKRELVMSVKTGQKLFLYDFDSKLLYGVYKATSAGGMKLEPSAFNGSYPAQVRFKVDMDCLPLSDGVFKKAIEKNVTKKKSWFNVELTVEQVKTLLGHFRPSSQRAPRLSPPPPIMAAAVETSMHPYPYGLDESRRYYAPHTEAGPRDPLAITEKDYWKYGLRPPAVPAPGLDTFYSYPPRAATVPDRRADYPSSYRSDPSYRPVTEQAGEAGRLHSMDAADALSDYNRGNRFLPGGGADAGVLPVSSRYSFGGPPLPY